MKLKKPVVFALSLCVALGAGMTAVACGEDENVTYTINIDADASALADVKVLFYSDDASKAVSLSGTSASAELPEGNYTVYLTGKLAGYTFTPVQLSKTRTSATLSVEEVEADDFGRLPYQFLVLYPGGEKIFKGGEENGMQICTSAGQSDVTVACFDCYFDDMYMATRNMFDEQFVLKPALYDIHLPDNNWPEGYTFDEDLYKTSAVGGFCSVELQKA